jgi:non-heme chloroperoxidase
MNRKSLANLSGPTLSELLRPLDGIESVVQRPDGTRLRVVEKGSGADVLLVHGFSMSADAWSLVQPTLVTRGHRVVAYDSRAHGRSTCGRDGIGSSQLREDLRAVAEQYDLRGATLICHSMGNFVALGLLPDDTFRKRFRRAVLVNPVTGHSTKGAPTVRLQAPLVKLGMAQRLARVPSIGAVLAAGSLGSQASSAVVEATRLSLAALAREVVPCLPMLRRESVASVLPFVELPVHVLTGSEDKTTPGWHAELIAERTPQARIDVIAGTGHMITWEAPEEILRAVTEE